MSDSMSETQPISVITENIKPTTLLNPDNPEYHRPLTSKWEKDLPEIRKTIGSLEKSFQEEGSLPVTRADIEDTVNGIKNRYIDNRRSQILIYAIQFDPNSDYNPARPSYLPKRYNPDGLSYKNDPIADSMISGVIEMGKNLPDHSREDAETEVDDKIQKAREVSESISESVTAKDRHSKNEFDKLAAGRESLVEETAQAIRELDAKSLDVANAEFIKMAERATRLQWIDRFTDVWANDDETLQRDVDRLVDTAIHRDNFNEDQSPNRKHKDNSGKIIKEILSDMETTLNFSYLNLYPTRNLVDPNKFEDYIP